MRFYSIGTLSSYGTKFAWADGYGPLENMPFFEDLPDTIKIPRLGYWSVNPSNPGLEIYQGSSVWPDCIGVGIGWPYRCYSNRIVEDLEAAGIGIWRKTGMPIASVLAKRLLKKPAPRYFVLEAEHGIETDYDASGVPRKSDGSPDVSKRPKHLKGPLAVKFSTWNGKPLFSCNNDSTMVLFCTEEVKQLAEDKGWTNVKFEEVSCV